MTEIYFARQPIYNRDFQVEGYELFYRQTAGAEDVYKRQDLHQLTMPILNVYATQDHLVPPAASKALAGLHDSRDYSCLLYTSRCV